MVDSICIVCIECRRGAAIFLACRPQTGEQFWVPDLSHMVLVLPHMLPKIGVLEVDAKPGCRFASNTFEQAV